MKQYLLTILLLLCVLSEKIQAQSSELPKLVRQNDRTQLTIKGEPFLMRGGELGNSSASSVEYMQPIWKKLQQMNCNTVLVPVYWELIEPMEGKFDFNLLSSLIDSARHHDLKIVILWFGSWKNSMSCYVPEWVKKDHQRFPRVYDKNNKPQEILTAFNVNNLNADIKAFRALMEFIRQKDEKENTVIMVQVENEIGNLPEARDYHPDATKAFKSAVPAPLMQYLARNKNALAPALSEAWKTQGFKTKGSWEEVFGTGLATEEYLMAWYLADFANKVTAAGKKVYPLPMFVNAALNRPGAKPGEYPSGGPLPHLVDIWKAAAPEIDMLSPDFYNPNFTYWNDLYSRKDNALFIPEIRFDPTVGPKALFAVGHYHALGFSPFSIESTENPKGESITGSYNLLKQLEPLIYTHPTEGVLLNKTSAERIDLDQFVLTFKHEFTMGWSAGSKDELWPEAGAIIIKLGEGDYIIAGTGIVVTFESKNPKDGTTGILTIDEGQYVNGKWVPGRRMNGDQSHQGRHLRTPMDEYSIQRVVIYQYK